MYFRIVHNPRVDPFSPSLHVDYEEGRKIIRRKLMILKKIFVEEVLAFCSNTTIFLL